MKAFSKFILLYILLVQSTAVHAWNAAGHQLMAAMTWNLLSNQKQNYWVDILKHHPRFLKDFKDKIPKYVKFNPSAYKEWIFRQAAVWPDLARGFQPKSKKQYHHGSWHYINYPLYLNAEIDTQHLNISHTIDSTPYDSFNIIQAIKANSIVLSKQGASKKEKALALSWLLHLVGDSHQPLHSTALFSADYFPKGDRGGNLLTISGQGRISNLHWYWDSRLNYSTSFKIIGLKANKINKKHHEYATNHQKDKLANWIASSHSLAKKHVYTPVLKQLLNAKEELQKPQPSIYISNSYDKVARAKAEMQIIKAAYQMAELLQTK